MRIHCLFEQSGTFKNVFRSHGIESYDYDILNDYGQTDFKIDLFKAIEDAHEGKPSIFDTFQGGDVIFAFFPCIRFSKWMLMHLNGTSRNTAGYSKSDKVRYFMRLERERSDFAQIFSKMVLLAFDRNLGLIVENPDDPNHYLIKYFPILPKIRIDDRTRYGDKFRKPTAFWFINIEPKNNFVLACNSSDISTMDECKNQKEKSLITPEFAEWFYQSFIKEGN